MEAQHISLFFKQGGSDKQYDIALAAKDDGWVVNYANGKRGSTLKPGTKTSAPLAYEDAKKIFDKLVREKTSKGYTPAEGGTPFAMTDKAAEISGFVPQLLNSINEKSLEELICDESFVMQQKYDGERRPVRKGEEVVGINKKGLFVALPQSIALSASRIEGTFLIDGEQVGETIYAFDLIEKNGVDMRKDRKSVV